ncbi:hypothetical protein KJS94_12370 [Flavihumibacter rivuli]|uniref:hypothetical protein n=1 Tax=Flavihumibacter rivuli TaxID=2838156 RepID=UPI001BDF0090|nr:hypothetical protein [Flavihumibacter rivuli]ULQ55437.1 hypothetical protein KJS94_12370 [Flavihumibacter rivuli]
MQFAGSFYDQQLWFRKTNNDPAQQWSKVLLQPSGQLYSPAGSSLELLSLANSNGSSTSYLKTLLYRHTTGTGPGNTATRLQSLTDGTNHGYVDFNPVNGLGGMALGTNGNELLRLQPNGYLGIGASNPLEKIQIGQKMVIHDGGEKVYGYNWYFSVTRPKRITDGYSSWMTFYEDGSISFRSADYGPANSDFAVIRQGLTIKNDGTVGVGTPDTKGYQLAVAGSMIAEKVKVKLQGSWPDYVFDSSYTLRPITELETYIKKHKHLPDIPSASEVADKGLDVGENQSFLLKKIEELSLYIIELNKQNEQLKHSMRVLEEKFYKRSTE